MAKGTGAAGLLKESAAALSAMALKQSERQIAASGAQVEGFETQYHQSLATQRAWLAGHAAMAEEEAWMEWQGAVVMLEAWHRA